MSRLPGSAAELERRRKRAVAAVGEGEDPATVADVLGVHPKTVAKWVRMGRTPGGLDARPQPGPTPGLTEADVVRLEGLLLRGTKAHGWSGTRQNEVVDVNLYPLVTHYGRGLALPCARDKYFAICVQAGTAWAALAPADVFDILEQAGVFAHRDAADAYWYGGPQPGDMFAVFYGVQMSPGPEQRSVLTPVIKKVAVLNWQDFVDQHRGGNAPAQPVNGMKVDYNPPPGELIGGDEGYDDDMPDLRSKTC